MINSCEEHGWRPPPFPLQKSKTLCPFERTYPSDLFLLPIFSSTAYIYYLVNMKEKPLYSLPKTGNYHKHDRETLEHLRQMSQNYLGADDDHDQ